MEKPTTLEAQLASCEILLFGIPLDGPLGYSCQQAVIPFGLACPGPADENISYSDALLVKFSAILCWVQGRLKLTLRFAPTKTCFSIEIYT